MKKFKWMAATVVAGLLACCNLSAHGRIDAGPIYVHMDVLNYGKTYEKLDMEGFRADGYFQVYSGLILKPSFTIAGGHGEYYAGTLALGFYIPMGDLVSCLDGLSFLPQAGWTGGRLSTNIDTNIDLFPPLTPTTLRGVREIFRSNTGFIGIEGSYQILYNVTISGSALYGWSGTRTTWNKEPYGSLFPRTSSMAIARAGAMRL